MRGELVHACDSVLFHLWLCRLVSMIEVLTLFSFVSSRFEVKLYFAEKCRSRMLFRETHVHPTLSSMAVDTTVLSGMALHMGRVLNYGLADRCVTKANLKKENPMGTVCT